MDRARSWSVILFCSQPTLTPKRIFWSKSSESSHFKISNKTINKCITWGTVSCFCHIQLSVLMLIYTSWEPAPLYFIYSCSPLKNRQVHLVIFPRLLKSVTKLLMNFFLILFSAVSLHGKNFFVIYRDFSEHSDYSIYCVIS